MTDPINSRVTLKETQQDYAVFLPSISAFYNKLVQRRQAGTGVTDDRIPKLFENDLDGLNFLKPTGYFHYPWALYSAGHAELDITKTATVDLLAHDRDRTKTLLLGDSGGYQIGTGVIKLDWPNFYNTSTDGLRQRLLDWLEYTCDYSMLLDIPTRATELPYRKRTGLTDWRDCLKATLHNNDYFIRNRQYKTKFLNVLQGQDIASADIWYQQVKHFPVEGWALGGFTGNSLYLMAKRFLQLRDEKLLEPGRDIIHVLGNGRLDWSVLLTHLQRILRQQVNPNLTITYDCSTPFFCVSKGQQYTSAQLTGQRWTTPIIDSIDNYKFVGSDRPFPGAIGEISKRLRLGDICVHHEGAVNSRGQAMRSSWDSLTYALIQAYNVEQHIMLTQQACRIADWQYLLHKDNIQLDNFQHIGKKTSNEHIPDYILYSMKVLDLAFSSVNGLQVLTDNKHILDKILIRSEKTTSYDSLFQ